MSFDLEEPPRNNGNPGTAYFMGVGWKNPVIIFRRTLKSNSLTRFIVPLNSKAWDQRAVLLIAQAVIDCMNQIVATPLFSLRGVTVHNYCEFDVQFVWLIIVTSEKPKDFDWYSLTSR